ncbi:hypothetical protein [Legionella drancourtii]|uniref:Uncharacterized protein n=1 Tax=Legionella drancourtii LLAP12 TaxID=658187 RepID=G9ET46_9GAMM|nr:hypothetical protein [Legionella drancourtii]EHL29513.1 hypothetical protein LDG_8475 [Legionella drancourtii LLAP12]
MGINSTSKMFEGLGISAIANKKQVEQNEAYDMPCLTPSTKTSKDMKNALTNALGLSSSKNYSPMD